MAHHINIEERVHPVQKGLNKIVHDINEKVRHLPTLYPESCIYKVHQGLHKSNPDAYTPMLVSIGPYHHGKPSLHGMEEHKLRYLDSLLKRRKETSVEKYILALAELEDGARKCYADPVDDLNSDEFVEMMLLDSIFIIEFVRKWESGDDDPVFMADWMVCQICRDMILLENQLPFSVLSKLYDMTKDPEQNISSFVNSVESVFSSMVPKPSPRATRLNTREIKHLLDLVRIVCSPKCTSSEGNTGNNDETLVQLQSVIELEKFGVEFKNVGELKEDDSVNLFDIKFKKCRVMKILCWKKGVLEIPCFKVDDLTETFFRNMIAHEQHSSDVKLKYFTDYAAIMDQLINSKEDVKLLRLGGILVNLLGDDKEVSRLFNRLGDGVINSSPSRFYYFRVCDELKNHCAKRWFK